MIDWFKPTETVPVDGQNCLLLPHDITATPCPIYGPVVWVQDQWQWADEAAHPGVHVMPAEVAWWTDWDSIKPQGAR